MRYVRSYSPIQWHTWRKLPKLQIQTSRAALRSPLEVLENFPSRALEDLGQHEQDLGICENLHQTSPTVMKNLFSVLPHWLLPFQKLLLWVRVCTCLPTHTVIGLMRDLIFLDILAPRHMSESQFIFLNHCVYDVNTTLKNQPTMPQHETTKRTSILGKEWKISSPLLSKAVSLILQGVAHEC